jgi:hypothetical protein
MKLITGNDKDARLILCVFARKHEKQNRQLLRVLSPENPPTVSVKKIGTDGIQIEVSTFDVYACLVFE